MGDKVIEGEFAIQITLYDARQLRTAFHTAKRGTAPYATGHQLERTGGDLFTGTGHADNDGFAPAFVTALQRGTHYVNVADALEGEVHAAVDHFDDHILNWLIEIFRVDQIGGTEFTRQIEFAGVEINPDDAACTGHHGANNRRQANTAEAEDRHGVAFLHFGGIHYRAHAGGHAATEQTNLFKRCFFVDFRQ